MYAGTTTVTTKGSSPIASRCRNSLKEDPSMCTDP
jgi:hypothetical protein